TSTRGPPRAARTRLPNTEIMRHRRAASTPQRREIAPIPNSRREQPAGRGRGRVPMRDHQHRAPILAASLVPVIAPALPLIARPLPRLVYNATASAPLGFYRLIPAGHLARGDLVLAHLPEAAARLAADRRYLPLSVPVVKRVAALAGDLVVPIPAS